MHMNLSINAINYIESTTLIQFFKKSHFPQKKLIIFEESRPKLTRFNNEIIEIFGI